MIKYTNADKTLVIPSGLGNFGQGSGSGSGVTPQEVEEIASAVTAEALDEYDTELQVELEEIRDAVSASTGTLLDLSQIAAMTQSQRITLFDEVFEKASNGEKIYIKGLVQEETIRTAVLPLVSYRPETEPLLHTGGNLYFAAKGDTDNVYFHVVLSSEGSIDPTSGNIIKRNIYNLPTASAEVKGGVRIGSGLTITQDTLSLDTTGLVTDGDLAPFIVQQSANTENIASLSAATEAISDSLGNYATTATTDALSAVTSALTESVAGKQDTLSAGNGIDLSGNTIYVKIGEGLAFSGDTLVASGGSGGKTPIVLEEHYDDPTWTSIYNAVAQSAVTMGVDEFAKNYDIYLTRNGNDFYQAVGYAIQQGEDDGVTTNWLKFYTFDNGGYTYWLLSTGSRGLGPIGGFDNNIPHPKSAWINIDASGDVIDYNISEVDQGLAQYNDRGTDYAFSMYLCCLVSDAERYRGNLQNYRKNYNGVNGNHFFRFVIDMEGTEYEAEYYYDKAQGTLVKIVFQTYKAYLQNLLNS